MAVTVPTNCIQVSDLITALNGLSATALVVVPAPSGQCNAVPDATSVNVGQSLAYYRPNQPIPGYGNFQLTQDAFSPDGEGTYTVVCIGLVNAN